MITSERIWAMPQRQLCWNEDNTNGVSVLGYYEYVRADLHDATKAQLAKAVETLRACRATFIRCQWDEKSVAIESIDAALAEIEKGEPK